MYLCKDETGRYSVSYAYQLILKRGVENIHNVPLQALWNNIIPLKIIVFVSQVRDRDR